MFRPLNDSVVVEPIKTEAIKNGVILTEGARDQLRGLRAVVIAVGPGPFTMTGARLPMTVKEGDVVVLSAPGALINEGDRVYSIVSERQILCVVEDAGPVTRYSETEHSPPAKISERIALSR